ncbi:hypothetical protein [Bradyrhizobium sp. CCBAU 51753]|uniref:hypothetical protein n=1 Tax=Bradyrhizobium sp. CCBAU 51753 TaxID=1325100 RepID=UPI00188D6770|nr:hypothetical protein [Bradyrhizobium sp. CCBAU 51753]
MGAGLIRTMMCIRFPGLALTGELPIAPHRGLDGSFNRLKSRLKWHSASVSREMMPHNSAGSRRSVKGLPSNLISNGYHLSATMTGSTRQQQVSYQLQKSRKIRRTQ